MNRAGVFVCRLFVGVGEAMFGQAMALHLSFWYTKSDLAKRVGLFISAGALSGAFGGLSECQSCDINIDACSLFRCQLDSKLRNRSMAYPLPHRRLPKCHSRHLHLLLSARKAGD